MVEPVSYVFERLRANYEGIERVSMENAAIADRVGALSFYHLAPSPDRELEGLPRCYDGIGSFSREFVLGHARSIPDIERRLVESEVPTLTFDALCAKHGLDSVIPARRRYALEEAQAAGGRRPRRRQSRWLGRGPVAHRDSRPTD